MSENGGQRYCLYTVAYNESPDCPLQEGEPYAFECDCWCNEMYILNEPCAGTYLVPLDPECRFQE